MHVVVYYASNLLSFPSYMNAKSNIKTLNKYFIEVREHKTFPVARINHSEIWQHFYYAGRHCGRFRSGFVTEHAFF